MLQNKNKFHIIQTTSFKNSLTLAQLEDEDSFDEFPFFYCFFFNACLQSFLLQKVKQENQIFTKQIFCLARITF